jgi:hypothetical protein
VYPYPPAADAEAGRTGKGGALMAVVVRESITVAGRAEWVRVACAFAYGCSGSGTHMVMPARGTGRPGCKTRHQIG